MPSSHPGQQPPRLNFLEGESRPKLAVAALAIGLLSGWMFWIIRNFLTGNSWYDWIVGLLLEELILAALLFSLLLLIWAIFAPPALTRAMNAAWHKLTRTIVWLALLFFVPGFFLILSGAVISLWNGR